MTNIKTTLGDASLLQAVERLGQTLAPGGDWTAANQAAAEFEREMRVEYARKSWLAFVERGGLERFAADIARIEVTGSDEHKLFINQYLEGFEKVFNRQKPGMFVSGGTGIGKTYNAVMFCKYAMLSPDFVRILKTEWAGKIYENRVPAICFYSTSSRLLERLGDRGWNGESREHVLAEVRAADIAIIDDVGVPSELGKRNGEVGLINDLARTIPTGLILQTRLSEAAFSENFGESVGDIVRRFAKPYTAGCQSRRKWGAA
jgi:DNA replication protein DnaC